MSALRSIVSSPAAKTAALRPSLLLTSSSSPHRLVAAVQARQGVAAAGTGHPMALASGGSRRYESQSAFGKFFETLKGEIKKQQDMAAAQKTLQSEAGQATESETLKKAKEAFEKAKEGAASAGVSSEKLKQTADAVRKATGKVGETVQETLKGASETEFVKASKEKFAETGKVFQETVEGAAKPIVENPYFQNMKESVESVIQDTESRYGGFTPKSVRRRARGLDPNYRPADKAKYQVAVEDTKEDPNAGESMVLHKDAAWKESWNKFKDTSPVMQKVFDMKKNYEESDNVFVAWARVVTDKLSDVWTSMLDETENAQAVRAMQMIDRRFKMERFMKDCREFIIPEVMEAYLNGDSDTLKEWCSEATYNVLTATIQAQIQQGLVSDCKILELRHVDLVSAKVLENDVPVMIVSFQTQEIIVFRNRITKEIVYGKEDAIEEATYACVITLDPDQLLNPLTRGIRVMDMAKHNSRSYI